MLNHLRSIIALPFTATIIIPGIILSATGAALEVWK